MMTQLVDILAAFDQISLDEMKNIRLMNRTDTKFITSIRELPHFLQEAKDLYYIQEIDHCTIMPYNTIYYDTANQEMYMAHHNGRKKRKKVRIRSYVHSNICFLEIKNKNNKGKTQKERIELQEDETLQNADAARFLAEKTTYTTQQLIPYIENNFKRITLVNKNKTERLTVDFNITFYNHVTLQKKELPSLVIIELKREGHAFSPLSEMRRHIRIPQTSISKYCIGSVLTNPSLKHNCFKEKIRAINRLDYQ